MSHVPLACPPASRSAVSEGRTTLEVPGIPEVARGRSEISKRFHGPVSDARSATSLGRSERPLREVVERPGLRSSLHARPGSTAGKRIDGPRR
jgi:hypothetical protein